MFRQSIAYVIYFIISIDSSMSLLLNLQPNTFSFDFTLNKISDFYQNIPFQLPSMRLCFGSPTPQCLNLVISTTLLDTVIEISSSAEKHFTNQFNTSQSSTFDDNSPKSAMGFPLFGIKNYYFKGKIALDTVRIPELPPLKENFFFVASTGTFKSFLLPIDGYLGMTRYHYSKRPNYSFLTLLYRSQLINKHAFTLNYNSEGGTVLFGENNSTQYDMCDSSNKDISKTDWHCNLTTLQMGSLDLRDMAQGNVVFFNSATSAVIAPYAIGIEIMRYILMIFGDKCYLEDRKGFTFVFCERNINVRKIPLMHLLMSKSEMMIDWSKLMKLTEVNDTMAFVSLLIVDNNDDGYYWHVGAPGFMDHSVYFDRDNMRIGIKYIGSSIKDYERVMLIIVIVVLLSGVILNFTSKKRFLFINLIQ